MKYAIVVVCLVILFGVTCRKESQLAAQSEKLVSASNASVSMDGKIMVIRCDTTYIDTTTAPVPPVEPEPIPEPQPEPAKKNIVFFGSSTIALWNIEQAFPGMDVKKAGFGGRTWAALTALADTIKKLNPKQVVIYSGDNDVIARRSVASMTTDVQKLCNRIWLENPDVPITFLYTKPSDTAFKIVYADGTRGVSAIEYVNRNIANWGKTNHSSKFTVIDTYAPFILWNPKRLAVNYYVADKLHLNQGTGYPVLNRLLTPMLKP